MNISQELKKIAKHYGYGAQSNQLIEECAELIQAVSKYRRAKGRRSEGLAFENLVEEIADVEIMLEQVKYLLHIPEQAIASNKVFKILRTQRRIAETKEG